MVGFVFMKSINDPGRLLGWFFFFFINFKIIQKQIRSMQIFKFTISIQTLNALD